MILSYSLISSVILCFGYLAYRWLMAGESQHSLNRNTLLMIYVVSLAAPIILLTILLHHPSGLPGSGMVEIGELTGGMIGADGRPAFSMTSGNVLTLVYRIYIGGAALTAVYFLFGLGMLARLISRGEKTEFGTFSLILVEDTCKTAPFSWGRSIVMTRRDYEECGDMILVHEHAHLCHRHWLDLLFAYAAICVQWYNPAAWAIREELKAVHEYQADETVMSEGVDLREYQMLLLNKAAGYGYQSLANSLNHSKLKKRVTMMYKKKTSLKRRLSALALVPAIGAGIAVTAIPSVAEVLQSIAETPVSIPSEMNAYAPDKAPKERDVYVAVENVAEFPGGMEDLMKWLNDHIVYPKEAEKEGIQGRVIIKVVIEADGSVTNPEIIRGVSPALDEEAIRIVSEMPKWQAAKVNGKEVASYFHLPIVFRLNKDEK